MISNEQTDNRERTPPGSSHAISIVVPVFDQEPKTLERAIRSVLEQSVKKPGVELIVVDDSSSNDCVSKALHRIENRNIKVVRHAQNRGLNAARHTGVQQATGEWVMFLDSDDYLTTDAVEVLSDALNDPLTDCVFGGMIRTNWESGSASVLPQTMRDVPNRRTRFKALFEGQLSYTMCGRLFRRGLLSGDVFEMQSRIYHEDCVTLARILGRAENVTVLKTPIYFYNQSPNSITATTSATHVSSLSVIAASWFDLAKAYGLESGLSGSHIRTGIERLFDTVINRMRTAELNDESTLTSIRRLEEVLDSIDPATRSDLRTKYRSSATKNRSERRSIWTQLALRLKDKVVLIGMVDYQVAAALQFARGIRDAGMPVVILDYSGSTAAGRRRYDWTSVDPYLKHRIEILKYDSRLEPNELLLARLVISFNDFNPMSREALEVRRAAGVISLAVVEGINDFLRVDAIGNSIPYRRSTHVAVAGSDDLRFFDKETARVVGLPLMAIAADDEIPCRLDSGHPRIVLNVNFSYGVLEGSRKNFVLDAVQVCRQLGLELVITRHPMDFGPEGREFDSSLSQSQLLREGGIFVSRFGTGILEALVLGVPVIYFPPPEEKVDKFLEPLGAYQIARSREELASAVLTVLQQVESGHDFVAAARQFVIRHCNVDTASQENLVRIRRNLVDLVYELTDEASGAQSSLIHRWMVDLVMSRMPR